MKLSGLSSNGLLMMHGALRNALAIDDNTPEDKERPYQVREHADFRVLADELEQVLTDRRVQYQKIA